MLEAYLFGSRARLQAQAHSDVDVAVFLAEIPDSPFGFEAELSADLMSALGENRVDVVLLNQAPPLLYHRVLRDGVRLFSRDPRASGEGGAGALALLRLPAAARQDRRSAPRPRRSRRLRPMSPGQLDATLIRRHLAARGVARRAVAA